MQIFPIHLTTVMSVSSMGQFKEQSKARTEIIIRMLSMSSRFVPLLVMAHIMYRIDSFRLVPAVSYSAVVGDSTFNKHNEELLVRHPSNTRLAAKGKKLTVPADFKVPEPKPLSVADGNYQGALTGALAAIYRLGAGIFVLGWSPFSDSKASSSNAWPGTLGILRDSSSMLSACNRPTKPIIIYEYEASPFCRKVREACVMLDLTVEYRPTPGARSGWSDTMALKTKGKRTVPYMEDGDTKMFESDDIINYLFDTYGPGREKVPWLLKGDFARITATYAASARGYAGSRLLPKARTDFVSLKPIVLWGYEGSPFVRPVRETLGSLGLAHVMVNCGRGSQNRDKLFEKTGRFQVPYIEDPNTGINMFESGEIVKYLLAVYTTDE